VDKPGEDAQHTVVETSNGWTKVWIVGWVRRGGGHEMKVASGRIDGHYATAVWATAAGSDVIRCAQCCSLIGQRCSLTAVCGPASHQTLSPAGWSLLLHAATHPSSTVLCESHSLNFFVRVNEWTAVSISERSSPHCPKLLAAPP